MKNKQRRFLVSKGAYIFVFFILSLPYSFAVSSLVITSGAGSSTTNNYYNITNVTGGNITGNISAGYIQYAFNGSQISNSQIFQSSGRIGIGTTTPTAALHVNSSSAAGSFIVSNTTYSPHFSINGSNGYVAIGTPSIPYTSNSGFLVRNFIEIKQPPTPNNAIAQGNHSDGAIYLQGAMGGNTSIGSTGTGGRGADMTFFGGNGGVPTAATTSATGGFGGTLNFNAGYGGSPSVAAATTTGGQGGFVIFQGGIGGSPSAGTTRIGGKGGDFQMYGGPGGVGNTGNGGIGGGTVMQAGTGGSSSSGTAGKGGQVDIVSGFGGNRPGGTGASGGDININAGYGGSGTVQGNNGDIYISGFGAFFGGAGGNVKLNNAFGSTSGNTSIGGLTYPSARLHQNSGTAQETMHKFTAGTTTGVSPTDGFNVGITSTGEAQVKQMEDMNLTFYTNALERMRFTNNGRIGINTTNPQAPLSLGATTGARLLFYDNGAGINNGVFGDLPSANDVTIATHSSGSLVFAKTTGAAIPTVGGELMRIRGSDNWIGLGGKAPQAVLDFGTVSTGGAPFWLFYNNGAGINMGIWRDTPSANVASIVVNSAGLLAFGKSTSAASPTFGSEWARFDNTGRFGLNTTTPLRTLHVNGSILASNYVSADGTDGFTGTCTILGLTNFVVKNGLITGCV